MVGINIMELASGLHCISVTKFILNWFVEAIPK